MVLVVTITDFWRQVYPGSGHSISFKSSHSPVCLLTNILPSQPLLEQTIGHFVLVCVGPAKYSNTRFFLRLPHNENPCHHQRQIPGVVNSVRDVG